MSTIDSELEVETVPVLSMKGPRAGLPVRSGKNNIEVTPGGLATKIILARLNRYSNYNVLTDMKYALDKATFSPGMGTAGFWARVAMVAQRMVKSRHSSTHFFQASWNAILAKLVPLVPESYRSAVANWAGQGNRGREIDPTLGDVYRAPSNTTDPKCTIENRLGMVESLPTISEIRNLAAHQILEPILQKSIDRNFDQMMEMIHDRGWEEIAPKLEVHGVLVN
jgi:hypothetical protein